MGNIKVLDDSLVALISAGEAVENPASIVKELIENALDANTTKIDIEIETGGIKSIRVSDNGIGILKEDAPLVTMRHSTSKIASRDDLGQIVTYGFRGEALASISAVSNLEIITRHKKEETGTRIVARAGEIPSLSEVARPQGTTIIVTDLFGKVPARMKHLSDPRVESQRIFDVIMRHAIIRNDVGFRFLRDGNTYLDCPQDQSKIERALILWGMDVAESLIELHINEEGIVLSGFIGDPSINRGNRSREYFSVRKRPIEEQRFSIAVEEAYSTLLMKGRFPFCAIDIDIDVEKVDPNVHPTKKEIRIQDIENITEIIRKTIKEILAETPALEILGTLEDFSDEPLTTMVPTDIEEHHETQQIDNLAAVEEMTLATDVSKHPLEYEAEELGGTYRILGTTNELYILLATDNGILVVDQHAAHERILYEKLRTEVNTGSVIVQELLEPIVLKLDSIDAERIVSYSDILQSLGYEVSSFGGSEILVSTLPEILGKRATENELLALIDRILLLGERATSESFMDELVKVTACHSAIRAGETLGVEQIRALLRDLINAENRYRCCHGRPVTVRISKRELDDRFGRLGSDALERYRARHGIKK